MHDSESNDLPRLNATPEKLASQNFSRGAPTCIRSQHTWTAPHKPQNCPEKSETAAQVAAGCGSVVPMPTRAKRTSHYAYRISFAAVLVLRARFSQALWQFCCHNACENRLWQAILPPPPPPSTSRGRWPSRSDRSGTYLYGTAEYLHDCPTLVLFVSCV